MKVKEAVASYKVHKKRYTYQDYLDLPEDGKRYEIINGELVMVPAPRIIHQDIGFKIGNLLFNFNQQERYGKVLMSPVDVILSETNVIQPDILFISKERSHIITETHIKGAPDFIIEIISPSSGYYDLIEKKELYAQYGVREYWIVDPKRQCVEIYLNKDHEFQLRQRVEREGTAQSYILQGFKIILEQIFSLD